MITQSPSITLTPIEDRFLVLLDQFVRQGRKTNFPLQPAGGAGGILERDTNRASKKEGEVDGVGADGDLAEKIREVREVKDVECRIAGGWVRDKLLNLPSSDLDVTLSSIAGYPFALAFVTWLHSLFPPSTSPHGAPPTDPNPTSADDVLTDAQIAASLSSIGKVAANPLQSKHLETATTRIMGLDLDFVALRSESYADGSRIPSEVRLGTPQEDALRRDITINTLFYNVHTKLIEDHTGLGLSDLRQGIVRTPLPPIQTFRDDPLRILRCVRFASRFGFGLVDELKEALGNEEILEALRTRISRERVGIEVEKMLKGPDPLLSIQLMTSANAKESGLYPHIFIIPPVSSLPASDSCPAPHPTHEARISAEILSDLLPAGKLTRHVHPALFTRARESQKSAEKAKRKELWLACCLAPYRDGMTTEKKKKVTMTEVVIKEGLKLSNADAVAVNNLYAAATSLSMPEISYPAETIRSTIGSKLRHTSVHNGITDTHWTDSVLFSLVLDLLHLRAGGTGSTGVTAEETQVLQRYHAFIETIEGLGLSTAVDDKPILDGKEINDVLGIKPSQFTGVVLSRVVGWQFDHPQGSKEECKLWLVQEKEEGRMEMPQQLAQVGRAAKKQKKA